MQAHSRGALVDTQYPSEVMTYRGYRGGGGGHGKCTSRFIEYWRVFLDMLFGAVITSVAD